MITQFLTKILVVCVCALLLAGCQVAGQAATAQLPPTETVQAFYTWYLDYVQPGSEQMRNPLVDRAYRESPYLSISMIEDVDALLEDFEQQMIGGFDPFLMAQDFPQSMEFELVSETSGKAQVAVHQFWGETPRDLTVFLEKDGGVWKIDQVISGNPQTAEGLTELFLNLYIASVRARFEQPQSEPAYDPVDYFSYEFYNKVRAAEESMKSGGGPAADPILLAQDLLDGFEIGAAQVQGEGAIVCVDQYFSGNPEPYSILVYLRLGDSGWRIVDILPQEQETDASTPSAAVDAFYNWYLHQMKVGGPGSEGSDLSAALLESDLVSAGFVRKVGEIRESFKEQSGYDPVVCAQDVPPSLRAGAELGDEHRARVLVESDYPGYFLMADLVKEEASWLVDEIHCSFQPQTAVMAFYTEYLGYIGDPAGEFRNPLVDRFYQESDFLSEAFIRKIDNTLASFGQGGGYDPILMAQDIPQEIQFEAGEIQDTVIVSERFGESWQELNVRLVQQEGRWLIDDISRAEK